MFLNILLTTCNIVSVIPKKYQCSPCNMSLYCMETFEDQLHALPKNGIYMPKKKMRNSINECNYQRLKIMLDLLQYADDDSVPDICGGYVT